MSGCWRHIFLLVARRCPKRCRRACRRRGCPVSLANVVAFSPAAPTLILLGDPQQLDQPTQGTHPDGAGVSSLEHVLAGAHTISPDRGLFLEETWRLHPEICRFNSELFYDNKLRTVAGCDGQYIGSDGMVQGTGLRYLGVPHS